MKNDPKAMVEKAKVKLVLNLPFWGSIACRLDVRPDPACPTMYTDGKVVGYSPAFVAGLSQDEVVGVLAHEICHVVLGHHLRRGQRDPKVWNVAADYTVNDTLEADNFKLPGGCLRYPGGCRERTTDSLYNEIMKQAQQAPKQGQGSKGEKGQADGQGQGQSGSGDVQGQDWGEVKDMPGKDGGKASEAEVKEAEGELKEAIAQAAQQARAMGKLPAGLKRLVEEMLNPKVPWSDVLREFITSHSKNDYSWSRPNRRYVAQGLYLPSTYSEELGDVVVCIDTSGSIGGPELSQFAGEVNAILSTCSMTLHVVYCDAEVNHVDVFEAYDLPFKPQAQGGGGTDFRPPFKWVADQGMTPACLVYLTDMYGSFPREDPGYPVLWVTPSPGDFEVPCGRVLKME